MLDQIPASMRHFPVDCVISDNYRGGALLAEHLWKRPHKGLDHGTVSGLYTIEQRIQGFVDVYQKNGIDLLKQQGFFSPCFFWFHCRNDHPEQPAFPEAYGFFRSPYCCFLTAISPMGGFKRCQPGTVSVPQDISFVCFDDDPLFKTMSATMTCVSQDLTSMGKHAVELLLKKDPWRLYGFSQNRHAGCCIPPAALRKKTCPNTTVQHPERIDL